MTLGEWLPEVDMMVPVSGGELHCRWLRAANESGSVSTGTDAMPTLVFLHEGLGSIGLWRSFPSAVRNALGPVSMLLYSRHGYGRSDATTATRKPDYMHQEALTVLPALLHYFGIERPILIGHSDGASIALLHAASGHHVLGTVVIAPHVFVEPCTLSAIAEAAVAYPHGLNVRLARHHRDADQTFSSWSNVWLSESFSDWDIREDLKRLACPTLAIQGTADPYGSLVHIDSIKQFSGAHVETLVVDGAGHAPHEADLATCVAAIATFFFREWHADIVQ